MFLSHAVVPVFVFTIMLNFFYLYTPISSDPLAPPSSPPNSFPTCEDCQNTTCYKVENGTCALDKTNTTFTCFKCGKNETVGLDLYPTEELCKGGCSDPAKECVCDGPCYSCVVSAGFDKSSVTCDVPTLMVDPTCQVVPYVPTPSTPGSSPTNPGSPPTTPQSPPATPQSPPATPTPA